MQRIPNAPERQQVVGLAANSFPTIPTTSRAEYKPPSGLPAKPARPRQGGLLTPAQELLMAETLPIVRFIARRIHDRLPPHVPMEDLHSAGILGLLDALGRFDPSKQVLFRTYAESRIRGAILDSLRTLDWSPRGLRHKGRSIEEAIQTLTVQLSRSPTDIEIAQKINLTLIAYQQLQGKLKGLEIGSLHSRGSADSDEEELNYLPSRLEDDPLFRFEEVEMRERLTKAIADLPERDRLVITLYYYEEMSMREISTILDVVESRVSAIRASAVLRLRASLASHETPQGPRKENRRVKRRCMLPATNLKSN